MAEVQDTKALILDAARLALVGEGFEALSMRKVAQSCGLSATAIYRHFEDKDALLAATTHAGFVTFGSYLLDALEKRTPKARFQHLARRYFDFAREHEHDYRLMFMIDCKNLGLSRLDEVSRQEIGGTFQLLQDRIVECQRSGLFKRGDARTLAACTWASVHGLASLLLTGNLGESEEEQSRLVERQIRLITEGLT